MKLNEDKIKKYQVGGPIVYQPIPVPQFQPMMGMQQMAQPESGQAAPESTGPLDKEIVKELLGKGLTNDVMAFSEMVNGAYAQYEGLSDLEKSSIVGQRLRNMMKGDLGQLNNLRRNKDLLTGAISKVEGKDAGSDYAVTERGLIIKDLESGKIAEVTAEQYAANNKEGRYKILTNAELINEREYNPNLVNDTKSIQALNSAVGMAGVRDEVRSVLTNLGEVSSSNKDQKYIFKGGAINSAQLQQAVEALVGQGMDGFYKAGASNSSSSNAKNIEIAAEAMWANMSANSKSLLKARAAARGVPADQLEATAKELAVSLLKPAVKDKQDSERTIDYDSGMTTALTKGSGGGDEEKLQADQSYWEVLLNKSGDYQPIKINSGTNTDLVVPGFKLPGMQSEGKLVQGNSMLRDIPELRSIGDAESFTIGGMKIRRDQLDAVMYEGGEVAAVEMPAIQQGNTVIPDLKLAERYGKAKAEIQNLGNKVTSEMKRQVFEKHGIRTKNNGEPDVMLANFVTFTGKVNENAFDKGAKLDQTFLRKVDNKEEDQYKQKFTTDANGKKIEGVDYGKYWFIDSDVYRGQVYVHYNPGYVGNRIVSGNNIAIPKSQAGFNVLGLPNAYKQKLNQQSQVTNGYGYQE